MQWAVILMCVGWRDKGLLFCIHCTLSMQALSAEECEACKEALKKLLRQVYQPIVITELLILQGGPKQVGMSTLSGAGGGGLCETAG